MMYYEAENKATAAQNRINQMLGNHAHREGFYIVRVYRKGHNWFLSRYH